MKKLIIGSIVGAVLLFIWQFLSWTMLNVHGSQQMHTANQDAIITALQENLSTTGSYFIPRSPDEATDAERESFYESRMGKPWALVHYRQALEMKMGSNMARGFVANLFAAFFLCWLLLKIERLDFKTALLSSWAVGLIGYITINYINGIWFEFNTLPDLIDAVAQWGLCGIWLGYYLPSKT